MAADFFQDPTNSALPVPSASLVRTNLPKVVGLSATAVVLSAFVVGLLLKCCCTNGPQPLTEAEQPLLDVHPDWEM